MVNVFMHTNRLLTRLARPCPAVYQHHQCYSPGLLHHTKRHVPIMGGVQVSRGSCLAWPAGTRCGAADTHAHHLLLFCSSWAVAMGWKTATLAQLDEVHERSVALTCRWWKPSLVGAILHRRHQASRIIVQWFGFRVHMLGVFARELGYAQSQCGYGSGSPPAWQLHHMLPNNSDAVTESTLYLSCPGPYHAVQSTILCT